MNSRLRKSVALSASLMVVCATALVMFAVPSSASTQTLCEGPPPSSAGCMIGGETATTVNLVTGFALGVQFTLTDPGTIFTACYPVDAAPPVNDTGTDPISVFAGATLIAGPTAASGGCVTFNLFGEPAGTYTVSYTDVNGHFNDIGSGLPPSTVGDVTGIVPTVNGTPNSVGFGVSVNFYSNPLAPSPVSVTPTGSTTATFAFTGDGANVPFGGTTPWSCSASIGTVTPASGTGTTNANSIPLTGLSTDPTNLVTCQVHEVYGSSVGPTASASAFQVPPAAPVITKITNISAGTISVAFTQTGVLTTDSVTCTPVPPAIGNTVTASGTSPITVTGLTSDIPYTCVVTALKGAQTALSNVVAALVPHTSGSGCPGTVDAPTKLSSASEAFPGAVVSWAPSNDPSNCLFGYLVTPFQGSTALAPQLVLGHGTTTIVQGLTEGSSYTFTVAGVTGSGIGPASVPTGPVTIGTPAKAAAVTASHAGHGAIRVAFRAGRNNGAAITSFTAVCGTKSATRKSSPIVVRGLTPGKAYTCTVTATNSRGRGQAAWSKAARA